jgi:hypothetical protein
MEYRSYPFHGRLSRVPSGESGALGKKPGFSASVKKRGILLLVSPFKSPDAWTLFYFFKGKKTLFFFFLFKNIKGFLGGGAGDDQGGLFFTPLLELTSTHPWKVF